VIVLDGHTIRDADIAAVLECYRSGWLTMGPRTQAFEHAFATTLGVEHAVPSRCGRRGRGRARTCLSVPELAN
jgi:dTDP-4-amino-4,6-dideoxygalactose transaminase